MRFNWLPSAVEAEDWATMADLQHRVKEADEERELERWKQQTRNKWN